MNRNKIINNMIRNKINNETYTDRKEAKMKMGHANFNKALKNGEMEFIISTYETTDIIL